MTYPYGALVFLSILGLGAGMRRADRGHLETRTSVDLQAACEITAARDGGDAALIRALEPQVERVIPLPGRPSLLGAQWASSTRQLTVFDLSESALLDLDSLGDVVQSVGRAGSGPAEFTLSPVYIGSRQKMRRAADGRVLVLDDRFAHIFSGARQVQEAHFEPRLSGFVTDAHVARVTDAWILSTGARLSSDPEEYTSVQLYRVNDANGARARPEPIARVGSPKWGLHRRGTANSQSPYERLFRRTWDAAGRNIAVVSQQHFAVCVFSLPSMTLERTWRVRATPRRVDEAERERVLIERFGRATGTAPMMNTRIEDVYRDQWPAWGPHYYDITSVDDSTFVALRLDAGSAITADFIAVRRGYIGSVRIPPARSVLSGYDRGLLLLDVSEAAVEFLRVPLR